MSPNGDRRRLTAALRSGGFRAVIVDGREDRSGLRVLVRVRGKAVLARR